MFANYLFTAFYSGLLLFIGLLTFAIAVMLARILIAFIELSQTKIYKKRNQILEKANKQAFEIIEAAQKTAQETVRAAHASAETTLHNTETFMKKLNEQHEKFLLQNANLHISSLEEEFAALKDRLSANARHSEEQFDSSLSLINQGFSEKASQALNKLDEHIATEVESLHKEVLQKLEEAQHTFQDQSASAYAAVLEELETYKKERIEKINASINDILLDLSLKVFGRSLTLEEHQAFIIKSLEEAKHLLNA